ncbi:MULTISPECIES: PIG-L family deacetylase [Paraburkholderia]|uniref:PIG-L family deacetylase n=1 Tax=Paraburkholderia TaxID=1822464 RepID=UPI00225759E6|nr:MULTISPECIES: PIG-L family deacetylase [Paraburkholderia]MCX4163100.1 PIG-L family deacetylase [Paraburkholderia megapolitana]MDN7158596.1 PIG-L family deacetylase [Paraburkholderia sp. CHISQ3]MDQ6495643.1 PIG-L family deacetylase [Paraburkholderia megapolitana]
MSETSPRLFVLSPHFDDAVFSCGALLATHPDAAVCTVFAAPPEHDMHTEWDRKAGFSGAHEAIHARTIEDNRALSLLDAIPVRMPFRDNQYLDSPSISKLAAALEETIYGSTANTLLMPLGLFHPDHLLVYHACCEILPRLAHLSWFAYEDAIHRCNPGVVQTQLDDLARRGIVATPAQPAATHTIDPVRQAVIKHEAVAAYESQLRGFGPHGCDDVFNAERYWQLTVSRSATRRARK